MYGFHITEKACAGLPVERSHTPQVRLYGHPSIQLEERLQQAIAEAPEGIVRLMSTTILQVSEHVLLGPAPTGDWQKQETRALVLVTTQAGVGGRIALTTNCYQEEMNGDRVVRVYGQFPSIGIEVVGSINHSVNTEHFICYEALLVLRDGASFRIRRTGDLDGASPILIVCWCNGCLWVRTPRRFRHRTGRHRSKP